MCKRIFKFELQLCSYLHNIKFSRYCPSFTFSQKSFFFKYICNFLDKLLHPCKFYGRDMPGILFFIFASCEPLKFQYVEQFLGYGPKQSPKYYIDFISNSRTAWPTLILGYFSVPWTIYFKMHIIYRKGVDNVETECKTCQFLVRGVVPLEYLYAKFAAILLFTPSNQ